MHAYIVELVTKEQPNSTTKAAGNESAVHTRRDTSASVLAGNDVQLAADKPKCSKRILEDSAPDTSSFEPKQVFDGKACMPRTRKCGGRAHKCGRSCWSGP